MMTTPGLGDATNAGTPSAGGQLSGEVTRNAAIKRLQKQQNTGMEQKPGKGSYGPTPPKPQRI